MGDETTQSSSKTGKRPGAPLPPASERDVTVRVFKRHTSFVWRVAMPADGRFALTSSHDGTVWRWALDGDSTDGEVVCKGKAFIGLAMTADGSRAAVGDVEGTIHLFEPATKRVLCTWKAHSRQVGNVAFHAEGRELLSATEDGFLRRWDTETGTRIAQCKVPFNRLYGVAALADGSRIVGAAVNNGLAVWSGHDGAEPVVFKENVGGLSPVAMPADGRFAFTGTRSGTVAQWDFTGGRRVAAFEGHSGEVYAVAVTPDGRFCVSGGLDKTVRLWAAETGECLAIFHGHTGDINGIAITPDARRIASVSNDLTLRVWDIPDSLLARVATSRKRGYINAKVVLLGDSGVGKSGLAMRLWHDRWCETGSSHGMEIKRLVLPGDNDGEVQREVWLWDLAGQVDYRLTHQLFMEQTSLAVLVFDPQEADIFDTIGYWRAALEKVATRHAVPCILVAARCDRPGLRLTLEEVREWADARKLLGPVLTAACVDGHAGADELRKLIAEQLPWGEMVFRTAPDNFAPLKDAILALRDTKDATGVVVTLAELEIRVRKAEPSLTFSTNNLGAVTTLLAGEGVLHALPYGDLVVLQPSWVNSYASTLVKLAGEAANRLGHVAMERIQPGKLPADGTPRLGKKDEEEFLPALVELFLKRALAWKQETEQGVMLVFPNYVRLPRPASPPRPGRTVMYRFTGALEEIYCTLVVRLHYSGLFPKTTLYRQAVDFFTATDKQASLTMRTNGEQGELDVYFGHQLDADVQAAFQRFVHTHLHAKAGTVERLRNYACPKCGEEVPDRRAIDIALAKKRKTLLCQYCDADDAGEIVLDDVLEKQFAKGDGTAEAEAAGKTADVKISNASKEQIMVGEVMAIVGEADQILRHITYRDEGVDAEIEFNDARGRGTRVKLDLQLKAGDSHLYERADGTETFAMKEHYERYWSDEDKPPVLLLIRNSDGRIRYMNATKAIHAAQKKTPGKRVTRLVFTGEEFTKEAVLRLRSDDKRMK